MSSETFHIFFTGGAFIFREVPHPFKLVIRLMALI